MRKKYLFVIPACFFIILALLLNLKISSGLILGDYLLKIAGLPIMTNGDVGFNISGIIMLALLLIGVLMFRQYFKRFSTRFEPILLIALFISMVIYQPVYNTASAFAKSQIQGLKSIEYLKVDSNCTYTFTSLNDIINCHCSLKFKNYSHEPKNFQINLQALKEQIEKHFHKYTNIEIAKFMYDEKQEYYLPPAPDNFSLRPSIIPVDIVFQLKIKNLDSGTNGSGTITSPSISIYNANEKISYSF